jgi:hypothetical protein
MIINTHTSILFDNNADAPTAQVLARNFQVPISAFDKIPSKELYIFPGLFSIHDFYAYVSFQSHSFFPTQLMPRPTISMKLWWYPTTPLTHLHTTCRRCHTTKPRAEASRSQTQRTSMLHRLSLWQRYKLKSVV